MHTTVEEKFIMFTEPLEGSVPYLYADAIGLVTTAYGVLVDPVDLATSLPLQRRDGTPATPSEIAKDWIAVKGACCGHYTTPPECLWRGSGRVCMAHEGHLAAAKVTALRLAPEGVAAVTRRKLAQVNQQLVDRFPSFEAWPADAQLATISLAWACGAGFRFPRLDAALRRLDFSVAAIECKIANDHGTIKERNRRNATLYRNAALVLASHLDPSRLYWPIAISDETPTLPDLSAVAPDDIPTTPVLEEDRGASRHQATLDAVPHRLE